MWQAQRGGPLARYLVLRCFYPRCLLKVCERNENVFSLSCLLWIWKVIWWWRRVWTCAVAETPKSLLSTQQAPLALPLPRLLASVCPSKNSGCRQKLFKSVKLIGGCWIKIKTPRPPIGGWRTLKGWHHLRPLQELNLQSRRKAQF